MRPIDADRFLKMMSHWKPYMDMDNVREAIKKMPTIDAVPAVHCVDCIHLMFSDFYGECKRGYLSGIVRPDDYCSRGELKEDNT